MRILYVTQIIPYPPHGGILQRGYNLLRELGKHHQVHLLCFHHPDEIAPGPALERSRHELAKFCTEVEYFDLWPKKSSLHKLAAFAAGAIYPRPFSVLAHKNSALARRMTEIMAHEPPDLVHLDTIALVPYHQYCGSVPTVLAHHNIESQLMARRADHETSAGARLYVRMQADRLLRYERDHVGRFPLNITVSDLDAKTLQGICPQARTASIPNGVDTDYFSPQTADEGPAMIYTGGMNMFANRDAVDWFLEAIWPQIKAAVPAARFYAIGQRPSARLRKAAELDPSIEAPGFVDDVRPFVARSAVYVVPLRVGGGTRLKMVDAMSQGKAIVATTLGAEGIAGEHGTHFLLADDASAFAQTVIGLLSDPARRAKLGAAARVRAVERYSWPILGAQLAGLYSSTIEESRR